MKHQGYIVTFLVLLVSLLHGCTGAVVGGAATGAAVVHDRRSAGTMLDDEIIELRALEKIHSNTALLNEAHINVTSYNHVVLMTGEAPTEELRQQAYHAVSTIEKISRIHNEIVIATPTSIQVRSNDSWITAKVKTRLFKIKSLENFDPTRVKVITENSTVFLMGLLTHFEADAVTETARKTKGVKKVIKVLEYLD
jgi:osmotically-inducible protein OsmY